MVRSRLPESVITLHPFETNQNVLHRIIERMSHMKLPRNIRRRNHNGERFLRLIHLRMEIFLLHPLFI